MRYSAEPKFRKCLKWYGFLSFKKKFGDEYGKELMDTATKTGIDTAKTASKWATGDLIGNKIADKITSLGKVKSKEKENERQEIYIPPEKNTANYWWLEIVLHQRITNLRDTRPENPPRFITKKMFRSSWSVRQCWRSEDRYKSSKQIRHQCYDHIYLILVMHILL